MLYLQSCRAPPCYISRPVELHRPLDLPSCIPSSTILYLHLQPILYSSAILNTSPFSTSPTHPLQLHYSQYFSIFLTSNPSSNPSSTAPLYSRALHFLHLQPILHSFTILKSSPFSKLPTHPPQLLYTQEFSIC